MIETAKLSRDGGKQFKEKCFLYNTYSLSDYMSDALIEHALGARVN